MADRGRDGRSADTGASTSVGPASNRRAAAIACVLAVIGVTALGWAVFAAIEPGAPPEVAAAFRPPLWIAALLVGAFAIFHGHAHGAEMPADAGGFEYAAGFMVATAALPGSHDLEFTGVALEIHAARSLRPVSSSTA